MYQHPVKFGRRFLFILLITIFACTSLHIQKLIALEPIYQGNKNQKLPILKEPNALSLINPFQKVFEDLGIQPEDEVTPSSAYNVLGKLRDNDNNYQQVWTPWLSRAAVHVAKVSDDGEFLVVGGGYLLDTELHIYRWNSDERQYIKVWEAGSGIITRDVYDVAFGDSDNNKLIEIAAACADGHVYLFEQAHIYDPIANLENRFDFVWQSDNYFQATTVEFYDLDLDGVQDLVVGSWDKRIHIFEYTNHSGYPFDIEHWIELTERWNSTEVDDKIQSLGVGDFNNNGLPDIIVGTLSGSIYIFENDGLVMSPHGIEFPFPNDNDYRLIWNNSGIYQPIWNPIGQIITGDLEVENGTDEIINHPSDAVILAYGQGAWGLRYTEERDFYLEQLIQNFESWQMQGAYPLDNFADWMVREEGMNWQVYTQSLDGTKYPEPWDSTTQNTLDIFANSAITGPPPHSIHGGELFNRHEYKLFTGGATWSVAKAACEALGGHLVTIGSYEENNFVSNLAGLNIVWLGFSDSASEGNWKWVTGESVTYTNWHPGEPNNAADEDYAQMYGGGTWNDLDPGYTRAYVCEWEDWEVPSTTFYVNNTHKNATGTWNLGVGEEIASNGNSDPDIFIIFDTTETVVQPNEWNISVSNNLVNWHQVNSNTDISGLTIGKGLAVDVDPLFARKKIMSAQYIRLTLITSVETKARKVDAIVIPYVARPLTIAASVTIDPLPFSYNESNPINRIIFGGSDGRLLAFHSEEMEEIPYYKKYKDRPAELTGIPAGNYGLVLPTYIQDWDSYTDAYFNLGETIWSIQGTPKKPLIPSWRYIQGETKEFTGGLYTGLGLHHISRTDCSGGPGSELIITRDGGPPYIINSETGALDDTAYNPVNILEDVIPLTIGIDTFAFGDLYQGDSKDELIIFPWYSPHKKPSSYDSRLLPVIFTWITNKYQNPITLSDVDGYLYSYLAESTTYPSATIVDVDNDRLQDIILSNGRLALLWNIGTTTSPKFKFDFDYFKELNERALSNPIFSPNAWDYDHDGDYDIAYSYGRGSGTFRYGMDFFENHGTPIDPLWIRNAYVMKNPTTDGSLRFNNYTAGVIVPSNSNESSAESIWVWNGVPTQEHLRELLAETDQQNSYIIGTNPELIKLEVNLKQSPPNAINYGYAMVKSWSNLKEIEDWTLTLTTSYSLDGDADAEIIISDYDNNVYVFEHLIENTYKRAYKTHDLNHTELTNFSPYAFQELAGVSGTFQRTIYDHGNLLTAGFDYNGNGNEEFIITAGLLVYIFEATGFNDEFELIFEIDYRNMVPDYDTKQFSALATTPDFDGRGGMIALAAGRQLFLLRWDPEIGWLESFQSLQGTGFYEQPGNPIFHPTLDIQTILFGDINQDQKTELWIGGINQTYSTHGGVFFEGNEYRLFTELKTWDEAKVACESLGGHLVTITSATENTFVHNLAGPRWIWLGLSDALQEGNWDKWITGESNVRGVDYTNWNTGEPNNAGGNEDYGHMRTDGKWNDISDRGMAFICEWEKEKAFIETDTGFLIAFQSDFGNIHQIYDFPSISTRVNTLVTSDSDYDGNLELIIGHGDGIDVWEAQKSESLDFTRVEIISSDPNYGNLNDLLPTFDSYHSPVGLAPRAHDVLQIDDRNFFVIYGIEEEFHDPFSGNEKLVNTTNGDGRLYYSIASDPSAIGAIKSQQLFTPPQGLLISEVFYEDIFHDASNTSYHWVEIYNPNIFDVNLTNWYLQINSTLNISLGAGIIPSREYFVVAQNASVFNERYGFIPDYENTSLKFTVPDGEDTLALYYNAIEIDSTPVLTSLISIIQRKNQSNVIQTAFIPQDTDTSADWVSNDATINGTPKVRNYNNSDGLVDGVEYEPTVIQLQNGTILVSWVIAYNNGTVYDRCILSRNFDRNGNPISNICLIDRITSPVADPDTQLRSLGVLQIDNGSHDYIFYSYTETNTSVLQGKLSLKVILNDVLSDNSTNLGLEDYFIHSVDLIDVNGRIGIIFAGHPKNTFYTAQQLYFTELNSTYHNQGVFPITSGTGNARYPSAATMANYPSRIAVLYERSIGGKSEVVSIFSSDSGVTWSESYVLNSDDPYLIQTVLGFVTENDTDVINRQNYRPRVTDDGTGGIIYQFVSRFLIPVGDDNYSGNTYNYDGTDHNLVTQLWVGQIEKGHWFKFSNIQDVSAICIGDSDNDLRSELFVAHGYQVTLLEVTQDTTYIQKWQYQPPSYISLHPELINSTYAEFFVSDTAKPRKIGAVAIFDGNGNGWPELIFSVRGGDVFSFEVTNLEQPINELYAITEEYKISSIPDTSSATDILLVDINGGELDLVISDGDGISAWDVETGISLWNYTARYSSGVEKIYFLNNSLADPIIVGITSKGVCGVNLGGNEQYWINESWIDITNSHVFTDVNGDTLPDLIIGTKTDIQAIEPVSGDIIWDNVKPDNSTKNEGYFDISAGTLGSTTLISVCSGNLSIYKQVNLIDINGSVQQAFNLTHLSQLDTRSRSIIGDFDGDFNLDFAIVNFDNINTDESYLEVYDLSTLYLILNSSLPIPDGLDLSRFPIYARDVNIDTITDIILPIPSFTFSNELFPSNGYSSAIFAIDVATQTIIWQRYFTDSLTKFEIDSFEEKEIIITFTANSGLFALSLTGSDVLWTDLYSQSVAADIVSRNSEQTLIGTARNDGTCPIFRVTGMMTKASNIITVKTPIVDTNIGILYSDLELVEYFVIPVIVTNDGAEKLLFAFTNGTLILRSFDRGEIWRVQIPVFSSISAIGLEIEPGKFGLAFKTDTSDLYILERTTTQIWAQITTSGSIEASLSLDGISNVLLIQTISGNSGTLSLLDPITKTFIWTYTSPSYFTYLSPKCLDPSNIGKETHIVALDYLGVGSLIELPSTTIIGGLFPKPSVGTKWIQVKSIENSDHLATVVLLSNGGQLLRYVWLSNGEISTLSYEITDQDEVISLDVADQGSVNDIIINTPNNGSHILRDDGIGMTILKEFYNYYNDSLDHHFANIDDTPESEVVLIIHNSLVILTSEGNIIESHSLPKEIIKIRDWKVDTTMKVAFVLILRDNTIAVADPSNRIMSTSNGEAAVSNLKDALILEQKDKGIPTNNIGSILPSLELFIPTFMTMVGLISLFFRKRKLSFQNQRRSQL